MSSSSEQTVDTESPLLIKSRPVPRNESSSESNEYESPEEAADGSAEETDGDTEEEAEETEKPALPVVSKLPLAVKATIVRSNGGKSKTYDRMVYEALENLSASRRSGVSIQRILKYVNENNELPNNRAKLFFKKAIDKGVKENIYVHTSGTGCIGSIAFSTEHWNGLKKSQKKVLKAAEKEEKSKATAKSKAKPKQKAVPKPTEGKMKSTANVKKTQPVKDQNNNSPAGKAAAKKTKKPTKLSVALPTVKAKPKLKQKANKEKSTAKATKLEEPNTKGAKPKATTTTRSKS